MQKSKMAVSGGLTNSCEKKRNKKQRLKGKIYPFECRVPKDRKDRSHTHIQTYTLTYSFTHSHIQSHTY